MGRAFEYRRKSKEKRWDKMSKVFPKLAKAITAAAKDGGADPDLNPRLRLAIVNAKAENMPKDNIEAAIKRAAGKDADQIEELTYEAKGPHGVMLIIACATDNTNRTFTNVRTYVNKSGGQMVPGGSLDFLFETKAVVEFELPTDGNVEEIELELMDHGLEDFQSQDGTGEAFGAFGDFGTLTAGVESLGLKISSATVKRLPVSPVELTDEQMEEIEGLLDKIEDDEDVMSVFTNIA